MMLGVHPDPFNPITRMEYSLPEACNVRLEVYDVAGRRIATLVDGRQEAGGHSLSWDAAGFDSGVYFCRLWAGDAVVQRKLTLLK